MLTITGIIQYHSRSTIVPKLTARERYRAAGLCLQCGGERPCKGCGAKTSAWRKKMGKRR